MTDLLFWFFVLLISGPLLCALSKPERIYQYPYFMAAVFTIFILPQAVSLGRFPGAAPEEAVQVVLLVTCLCLIASLVGYRWFPAGGYRRLGTDTLNENRLFHAALVFICCGFGFGYLLSHMEVQTSEMGGWTGTATIYGFFQQLCYPGLSICLMLAIRRPTLVSVGCTLLAAIVPIESLVFGRREPAALFALTIGLTLYFQLQLRPARWLVMSALMASMLAIPATATYRRFQVQGDWESIRQIDLVGNFRDFLEQESVLELRNAAMLIEATRRSGEYQYGAGYWNHLVFRYIPAQLVGQSFKESLMIRRASEGVERELAAMDYVNPIGSTVTAMGDSFQQFGYVGCLFFALMGIFFRRLWRSACKPNALFAQLFYIQSCTCAMRAVTHWTLDFLPGLFYNAIFLGGALFYASAFKAPARTGARATTGLGSYLPNAFATIKISTAPPNPPPRRRYKSE
jgi:hypothetical protein